MKQNDSKTANDSGKNQEDKFQLKIYETKTRKIYLRKTMMIKIFNNNHNQQPNNCSYFVAAPIHVPYVQDTIDRDKEKSNSARQETITLKWKYYNVNKK